MEAGLDPAAAAVADPPAQAPAAPAPKAAPPAPTGAAPLPAPRPPAGAAMPPPPTPLAGPLPPPAPEAPKPAPQKGDVRLSLLDAIRHALMNNHDIQINAYEPPLLQSDVTKAWGVFDPTVFMTNQNSRVDRPTQTTIDTGSGNIPDLLEHHWEQQYGIREKMLSGGTVSLYQEQDYLKSNSLLVIPDPQYTTNFNAELKQPLLKGAGDLVNRAPIRVANLNAGIGLQQFRQKTMEAINDTVAAYWQLVFDMETLGVAQRTVDLAVEVLRREEVRRKDGVSNELSVNRALSAVATRQAEVVRNQTRIQNSADKLKLLMNAPEIPLDSEVRIVPTEKPTYYVFEVDRSAAVAKALINRPEIEAARTAVAINQIRVDVAHHEKMPRLDALLRYTTNGLGTRLGESYESQNTFDTQGWTAGLELEMPIPNRDAKGDWRRRLIEYQQSLLQADQTACKAIQEVNLAVRMILAARDEVEATLKAKVAAEMTVKGEFARFELGQTSNYELLQSQDSLGSAEREYLQALLNFNLALSELSRAQGTLLDDRGIEVIWPEGRHSQILPLRVQLNGPAAK
jgi:outer membrane protein TolC